MAKSSGKPKKFLADAIKKPGQLHRDLGIPQDETIPESTLAAAEERPGPVGRRARLAETMKKFRNR